MTDNKHFKVLQTVASGGTAVMYKALQVSLDRVVAIKRLHQHLTTDENFTRRFVLEAKAAASLDHENIVRVIDFGVEENCYQMVMEFVEGESLKDVLDRWRPVNFDLALAIVHQICRGLEHAHSKGIVHRDIKPGNVMLTKTGSVKITDFGLAKLTQGGGAHTAADSILGTPLYMSPEQAFGESVDQRSDLFSLGTVLYELLTGRQPFASENYMGVIQNIIHMDIPPVRQVAPEVPHLVEALVMRALAKNRDERFQTAREFRTAIEALLQGDRLQHALGSLPSLLERTHDSRVLPRPAAHTRATSARRSMSTSSPSWAATSSAMKRDERGSRAWLGVASFLVVVGGAAGFFYWPQLRPLAFPNGAPSAEVQQAGVSDPFAVPAYVDTNGSAMMLDSNLAAVDTTPLATADTAKVAPDLRSPMEAAPASTETAAAVDPPAPSPAEAKPAESKPVKSKPVEPEKVEREGYLSITADPTCEVYVNGTYRGDASPTLRLTLLAGRQTVECRHPSCETYLETITIVGGELSRRNVTLERLRGIISVATTEGAELYVDGQLIGITPIMRPIEVDAGTHTVTIKKANFYAWTSEVSVEANATLPLRITLSPRY